MRDLGQNMPYLTFDIASWRFGGHWPWMTPYMPIVASLAALSVSWGPEMEYVANFSHRHVYSVPWHYPTSISVIDPVCPQAILPMRVALFTSGMIHITNIWSRYRNNASLYSELNVEHVGEDFVSIPQIVFEIGLVNLKDCRFPENLTFDLWHDLITGSHFNLGSKNAPPIVASHGGQSVVFSVTL